MLELHCVYGVITTQMPDGHTDTHRDASRTKKGPPITCSVMCYYFYYTMGSKSLFFMQTISWKFFKTSEFVYLPYLIQQLKPKLQHSLTNLIKTFCLFVVVLLKICKRSVFVVSEMVVCWMDMASKIIERKSRTFLVKL